METLPTSASTSENSPRPRLDLLDFWRGVAVICMVIWHFLYDLEMLEVHPWGWAAEMPWELLRAGAVHSFLFLAGVSCRLSRNNRRRCIKIGGCALLITAVTVPIGEPITFGILHLLTLCVFLYVLLEKPLDRVPPILGAAVCLAVFAWLFPWFSRLRVHVKWLFWLGFRTKEFYSADYYPLLPWSMLFFAGALLGKKLCAALPAVSLPGWSTWIGRHALGIYLWHQPLLLALLYGWQRLAAR